MALKLDVPELPAADLIDLLADPHRAFRAYTRLLTLGPAAAEAARGGLSHPDARVREQCCKVLDHVLDSGSIPALIEALADPAALVRIQAVHALACDRCKTGTCRPAAEAVLPPAIALLAGDPSAHVRACAAELVGR
jgi:HEAT repeat protein